MSETRRSYFRSDSNRTRSESTNAAQSGHAAKNPPRPTATARDTYRDRPADDGAGRDSPQNHDDTPSRR